MTQATLTTQLSKAAELVEAELARTLPAQSSAPEIIHQAMRYSTLGAGKRRRALLVLSAAALRGGRATPALPVAAAIEMIHAYSLIHDDLPCMDDDDYRRGKLSNHKVFGEGMAVLAGDALLTQAFIVLADLPARSGLSPAISLAICSEVAQAIGTAGLIGGQVADMEWEGRTPDPQQAADLLVFIHTRKTGALFQAALRAGAMAGGLSGADLAAVTEYASQFGLAFQITDDILDVVGDSSLLGKQVGSDERKQKLTYPRLYGLEASRRMAGAAAAAATSALQVFGRSAAVEVLDDLAQHVVQRDH